MLGTFDKRLILVGAPLILSSLSNFAYQLVDSFVIAQLGIEALSGVGLGEGILFFGIAVLSGIPAATQSAMNMDSKDILRIAMPVSFLIGLVLALIAFLAGPLVMQVASDDPLVRTIGTDFLSWSAWSLAFTAIAQMFSGYFIGHLSTQVTLWAVLSGQVVNLVGSVLLVYGVAGFPAMGAAGAGLTRILSEGMTCLVYLICLRQPLGARITAIDLNATMRYLALIIPLSVSRMSYALNWNVQLLIAGACGTEALSVHTIFNRVSILSFYIAFGFGAAASALIGQALREGDRSTKHLNLVRSIRMTIVWVIAAVLLLALAKEYLFLGTLKSESARTLAGLAFIPFLLSMILDSFGSLLQRILMGLGKGKFILYWTSSLQWLFLIPVSWVLAVHLGWSLPGLIAAQIAYKIMFGLAMYRVFQKEV